MRLEGRSCIITGASGGLGSYLAGKFWQEGASLLLTGRDSEALEARRETLLPTRCSRQKVITVPGDLAKPGMVLALITRAKSEFESLTILVNNAAVQGPIGPLWENNPEEWEYTIRVDLLAPAALCSHVLPWMISKGHGKIINISGGGAAAPRAWLSSYAAAKSALVRLTETLAQETLGTGVDINALAPGVLDTEMTRETLKAGPLRVGPSEYENIKQQTTSGATALERAAELATFLGSTESDGITGRLISAMWDNWRELSVHRAELQGSDVYTLRRIVPTDRALGWNGR